MKLYITLLALTTQASTQSGTDSIDSSNERGAGVVEYLGLAAVGVSVIAILLLGMTDVTNGLVTNLKNMVTGG